MSLRQLIAGGIVFWGGLAGFMINDRYFSNLGAEAGTDSGTDARTEQIEQVAPSSIESRVSYNPDNGSEKSGAGEKPKEAQKAELNFERLYRDIKYYEGVSNTAYDDPRGYRTIGAGFNLDRGDARERISSLKITLYEENKKLDDEQVFKRLYNKEISLTDEQIDKLMKDDVDNAIDDAKAYLGRETWRNIKQDAREIVVNIAYNRGRPNLMRFKGVKRALINLDYARAADELEWEDPDAKNKVHTNWYKRTGRRAKDLIARMKKLGER